jgi:hypothetical protein
MQNELPDLSGRKTVLHDAEEPAPIHAPAFHSPNKNGRTVWGR